MKLNERGVGVVLFLGALLTALITYQFRDYPLAVSFGSIPLVLSIYVADTRFQPTRRKKK